MSSKQSIINEAKAFATQMLRHEWPEKFTYHCEAHTEIVVKAALEIGKGCDCSEEELEILQLAAWFHDLGYKDDVHDHEERSADMAAEFLSAKHYAKERLERVLGCIRATKMPQKPTNVLEEIICDADLLHLATDDYFEMSSKLMCELNTVMNKNLNEREWMYMNCEFIANHRFFTKYARDHYAPIKWQNLEAVRKKAKAMKKKDKEVRKLEEEVKKLKEKLAKNKEITPTRGIETMFRLTSKNHLDLSSMADNKANIMISVNSIILSVVVGLLIRKLEEYPYLTIPALILTAVCLTTIIFAILATRPNVSKGTFTREDIHDRKTNLLFFGNFHKMKREDYEWGMKEMMKDADYLYSSLINDIYFLGVVLGKKYRMLRIAYTVFMFGLITAVAAFIVAQKYFWLATFQ